MAGRKRSSWYSSSRVQLTRTGRPKAVARRDASMAASGWLLRPNAPPDMTAWTVTFSSGWLSALATASWSPNGAWVEPQTSTLPPWTWAMADSGSIGAWVTYGARTVTVIRFVAAARPAS